MRKTAAIGSRGPRRRSAERMPVRAGADRAAPLVGLLARFVAAAALLPFLPLGALTWHEYRRDVARVEAEIQHSNRHIAVLAARYLESVVQRIREAAEEAAAVPGSGALPPSVGHVAWERLDAAGRVVASGIDAGRAESPCGCLAALEAAGSGGLTPVGRWVDGASPTVLLPHRLSDGGWLVAVVLPEGLHGEMAAWSRAGLERHVYVVDPGGGLLFYSDLEVSRRETDLRANPPIERFLAGEAGAVRYRSILSGGPRLGWVEPVAGAGWGVVVSADPASRLLDVRGRAAAVVTTLVVSALLWAGLLWWASHRLVRPVEELAAVLRDAEPGHRDRLPVSAATRGIREYAAVVEAYEDLARRAAATEGELVASERAAVVGQLASGMAHEMGTPLNVILGTAQHLARRLDGEPEIRAELAQIERQSRRIAEMIRRLLDFARPAEPRPVPVDVGQLVAQTLAVVPALAHGVQTSVELERDLPGVLADPKLLEHALLNLVVNACEAMAGGGSLRVRATSVERSAGRAVRLEVADDGPGIPPEQLECVLEPFFTTKPRGTGLGLAIVDRIVRQHHGRLEVAGAPGRGTRVTMELPAAD